MANVNLFRGGTPDYKGWMCEGQSAEYQPPFDAPHVPYTPPFDSHADGAYGQGYLNLQFPLVPNLNDTYGHRWMQNLLKGVKNVNDIIFTNWVPTRAYVESLYVEVTHTDAILDGVYVTPVAYRVDWDFTTEEYLYKEITAFTDELTAAGMTQLPLGTAQDGDRRYLMARLSTDGSKLPCTFGHNIVKRDKNGKPTDGYDEYFGTVLLGLQVVQGDAEKIASIWKSNIAVWMSAKLMAFEGATQIG